MPNHDPLELENGENTLGGAKNVIALYYFLGVSMLELQPW
jgi:hypothetical protein